MTTTVEKIAVMQAFEDGKNIEFKLREKGNWETCDLPNWNWMECDYRIAEEPPKMVEKWLWIMRGSKTEFITGSYYTDESKVSAEHGGIKVIGKAEWSKITVEVMK